VQVFDRQGKYEAQWNNLHRPCAAVLLRRQAADFHASRASVRHPVNRKVPNLGPRPPIVDAMRPAASPASAAKTDRVFGDGKFLAPHRASRWTRRATHLCRRRSASADWRASFPDTEMPAEVKGDALPAEAGVRFRIAAVIARSDATEAIHSFFRGGMDCFA